MNGPYETHPRPVERAWNMRKRLWWVCCYAWPHVALDPRQGGWLMMENHWEYNVFGVPYRRWKLVDIKTFTTIEHAYKSHSLRRLYSPFNNKHALVVLRQRQPTGVTWLTEYKLYGKKDGHS